jgi:chaperonin GroES
MATKFTPLHDRILVQRVEEAGTTRGGIIIPDSAKDKPQEGEIISVGRGKTNNEGKLFPLAVKEGDGFCSASTRAPRSRLMGKTSSL